MFASQCALEGVSSVAEEFGFLDLRSTWNIRERLFSTTDQQPALPTAVLSGDSSRTFISPKRKKSLNFFKGGGMERVVFLHKSW